jgi:hypothetical protein
MNSFSLPKKPKKFKMQNKKCILLSFFNLPMMTNLQIASKIRQIREMRSICQDAVAAALQITTRAYSKL